MKILQFQSNLYSAIAWAIFTLGATQLALVLAGPVVFLLVMICCGVLFAFFLFKVTDATNRSLKQIAKPYFFSTGILLVATIFYGYLVLIKSDISDVIFLCSHILLFIIPFFFTIPFLSKSSNVSR